MAYGGRSQLKMSEETFDFVCTTCAQSNKTVEAVKYCVECSGYCCQPCVDAHKVFPTLRNHNLMEVSQGNQAGGDQSSSAEFPTERCSIHKGKVMDMYCEGHNTVGCYVCIAKDHKLCQDNHIHSIPDMIDTIFKSSDCKQIHDRLKDTMVSMTTVSKSKDTKLQVLNKSKKEALAQVNTFEKALEAILRKKAESSRQDIEGVYKRLETELLDEQHTVDSIHGDLKMSDGKLQNAEGNRAQRFVCSKIAQEQIEGAEREKNKQQIHNSDVKITFVPDQSLMKYVKALQGFGLIQFPGQKKLDLYKNKGSTDLPIKVPGDSKKCTTRGCCLTHDNHVLVTDFVNKKLKLFDMQKLSAVDQCTLDSAPYGVCSISEHEVAVACMSDNKIQFVSIQGKMTTTRQITMSQPCYGIATKDGKLYVTDGQESLSVYDMTGTLLSTISTDNDGNKLFNRIRHITFHANGNMVVGDSNKGLVCFDKTATYVSTITDPELNDAVGVCVDGRGNLFVVGFVSQNIMQYSEDGKKIGKIVDRLQDPLAVCFHPGLNKILVTEYNSDVVKIYELE